MMPVWEVRLADFEQKAYDVGVERLMKSWEMHEGVSLVPGKKGRVGIKVYTQSGGGLSTPHGLTQGLIHALERRGFRREQMFIYDLTEMGLRSAGYLPPRSTGRGDYQGVPVYALREGEFYDEVWFYDSPLPSTSKSLTSVLPERNADAFGDDRKSYLPIPLLAKADFWVNLPVIVDLPGLGVSGALANATLWNASNTRRFIHNSASAPVAVAEMAAIPELREPWVFTLLSLERYQFIGGPHFNSLYTAQEPLLWLSANPVALDALMYERMNARRRDWGLPEITPEPILFDYARAIGLGKWESARDAIKRVSP